MHTPDRSSRPRRPGPARAAAAALAALGLLALAPVSSAQLTNPVYVDDSPAATETFVRLPDLLDSGSLTEASRVLQRLLEEEGQRLVATRNDPNLFISVREAVHRRLLESPELLSRYRETQREASERMLAEGRLEGLERFRLLTPAGFEVALRLAQVRLERAQFASAWRTLEQLDAHPDRRRGSREARDAAELLTLVSGYLPSRDVLEAAHRWRIEADAGTEDAQLIRHPEIAGGVSPLTRVGGVDLSSLVSSPLRSEVLSIAELSRREDDGQDQRTLRGRGGVQPGIGRSFVMPVVSGDRIYVNEGHKITAWDRFALSPLWGVELETIDNSRMQVIVMRRVIEDIATSTIHGDWLLAVTGIAVDGGREGDSRIHAIDTRSGTVRWSIDPAAADPSLEESTVRGPIHIDQGVVVVSLAKHVRQRRLVSIHLAGFDLESGAFLWSRALGSSGTLPYGANALSGEDMAIVDGVAYRGDRLGFIAAVESATGRTRWIRRMTPSSGQRGGEPAWQMTSPVIVDDALFALAPDRREVVSLDAQTGALRIAQPAELFGDPSYMLGAGGRLVFVGAATIVGVDAADFPDRAAPVRLAGPLETPMVGRVVIAGATALAPIDAGILEVPLGGERAGRQSLRALDFSGNLVATESQIVVIDDASVHSYLLWDVAERLLRERMAASPDDPSHAATFAELAYRDGRTDRIVGAVDAALAAIERAPMHGHNPKVRRQLFDAVLAMVQPPTGEEPRIALARPTRVELFERLDRLAATSEQRAQRLMAVGVFHERSGEIAMAIDAYQRILASDTLAGVRLTLADTARPAQDEAASRLRRIVREHGPGVYAPYEAEAARELAAALAANDDERLAGLARRYPVARAGAQAWYETAIRLAERGRPRGAIGALENAMRIADDAISGADPLVGRIAGRLVRLLMAHGRAPAAAETLDRLIAARPGLVIIDEEASLDIAALRDELADTIARLSRRPRIGALLPGQRAQTLVNWSLAQPVIDRVSGGPTDVAVLASETEFSLWEPDPAGGVRQRWSAPRDVDDTLILVDDAGVLVSGPVPEGRALRRLSLATGEALWATVVERDVAPDEEAVGDRVQLIDMPMGLRRPAREAIVAVDSKRLAMIERTGLVGTLDRGDGRLLWSVSAMDRVYDAVLSEDMLIVAGAVFGGDGARETAELRFYDIASGQLRHSVRPEGGQIRWVRATGEGEVIAGLDSAVIAFDAQDASRRWQVGGVAGSGTVDAWAFPGRLVVMHTDGELRQIETEDGAVRREPLDTRGRFMAYGTGSRPVMTAALDDRAAFSTHQGLALFDRRGELAGLDHRAGSRLLTPAAFAADRVVAVDQQVIEQDQTAVWFTLLVYSADSLLLLDQAPVGLGAQPEMVQLVDGRILISAGAAVVVIDAPPGR